MTTSGEPTPAQAARAAMRAGSWVGGTTYRCPGYVQCNLVVLPQADVQEFLVYCLRNREACPVVDITDPGDPEPAYAAPGADLRVDLPKYRVFRDGALVAEPTDARPYWPRDGVAILIGSSLTFDEPLARAGVQPSPHVWVVRTALDTRPAGRFYGHLICTLRYFTPHDAIVVTQLTARFPWNHGAPCHIGDPAAIGAELTEPLVGPPILSAPDGKLPVFWPCGVTPQQVALEAKLPLMITHAPGHGFITDLLADRTAQP